ncbi:hypothetical protein DV702_12000 [Sporosarcina sp. PTS2304]|uniref:hypothetical protein n=1 Tax=Sporosarcina sp. PTS2304 TaxID=2283194 RepID=UPI000E0DEA9B|nr:hypothetical protein [Sporosarcina sp. PTS2304]AXI00375.1 hypothetical protein DV702_12000 [Sporosarcina sp. PTS2304]
MSMFEEELLVEYIVASTNLYGVTPFEHVCIVYNEQNESKIQMEDFTTFVTSATVQAMLEERFVFVVDGEFISEAIDSTEEKDRLDQAVRGKPYYVPDRTEFLKFVDEQYFQRTPQQEQLKQLLREDYEDSLPIDEEVAGLVYNVQVSGGGFSSVLSMFLEDLQLPIQQAERYIPVIIEIAETTRLWEHKGHTQKELLYMMS